MLLCSGSQGVDQAITRSRLDPAVRALDGEEGCSGDAQGIHRLWVEEGDRGIQPADSSHLHAAGCAESSVLLVRPVG